MHPLSESQQMPTSQGKSEVVFLKWIRNNDQTVNRTEIFAHAQDHSTEARTSSSFIMWASVEILLVLSITAPQLTREKMSVPNILAPFILVLLALAHTERY